MPPPLYGQLVHVAPHNFIGRPNSEGGNGYAEKDNADGSFDIRYCMDGSVEKNVNRLRITSYNPLVTTARRTNGTDVARPSILAPSHQPQQRSSPLSQPPTPPTSPRGIQRTHRLHVLTSLIKGASPQLSSPIMSSSRIPTDRTSNYPRYMPMVGLW